MVSVLLSKDQIVKQSENAYAQWKDLWQKHAKIHKKFEQKDLRELKNSGLGKAIVLIANGASLEQDMDIIKKHKDNIHTMVCDKTLGHCIKKGIKPTYCLLADAKVSFEKYCEPYKDQLDETILLINTCGNPDWSHKSEWKDMYFYVNKDVLASEKEFMDISGCKNVIPAGSNVSNAMVIFLTQADNQGRQNFFNYNKILLTGFDYSWMPNSNYYAYDKDAKGKAFYMRHESVQDINSQLAYTSSNLAFSAKWLYSYVTTFRLPIVQCSQKTIMPLPFMGKLKDHIDYKFDCEDSSVMIKLDNKKEELLKQLDFIVSQQRKLEMKHAKNVRQTL